MRIEYAEEDLSALNFNYVIQVNNHDHHDFIFKHGTNHGFWIEKRLSFLIANGNSFGMFGYYYDDNKHKELTKQELLNRLNGNKERYYRPLNKKELVWFNQWLLDKRT